MPLKGKSVDSVPSREKRISSRESVLSLIEFNKDRLTQIDREITRLTKKIDELSGREDLKQNDSFSVSSIQRRISTIQHRITDLNKQKSDLQTENKRLLQELAPPSERRTMTVTSKIDTSRLATRDNDEREFELERVRSIKEQIQTLENEIEVLGSRELSKTSDIRAIQLRTLQLKNERLDKLKTELSSLTESHRKHADKELLTSLLSQGFQEDESQKPLELTETAEDKLLQQLLSEEVPLSPSVEREDLVQKRIQLSRDFIEQNAIRLRIEFTELTTKIEDLTKEVARLNTEHSEFRQTLTNRQSKLSKRDRSELQSRMGRKYNELISAEEHLRDYSLRLEDVNKQLEDIDTGQEIRQVLRSQPEFDALLSQEPSATERDTLSEEERVAELKTEQSRIISEATNYFQGIWESGIIKDFAALDEFLKSSEFIQPRNEYLERISANLRGMLPLSEFSEKGLTRETLERFIESYSAGILTGIVFASVKNTYPNVYRVMAVFSKNRLSKCVSAINHFGILPTSGKDSGEIQLPSNTATENRSRDKIIEDARIFSSLLRSSGPHSSAFNAYLQFLDIEGLDASPSTDVNKIDDSEVISWMDRFIVNLVRNFPEIDNLITSKRQLSLFTTFIRDGIKNENLVYSRDRNSIEDAIRSVVQRMSTQEVLSVVGKPTIREKVSNFSNWLKKQTVRAAAALTLAAGTYTLLSVNASGEEKPPAPQELVEGSVPYNAGIEEALRQAGDSLSVTPSESRARYSLIREQIAQPENNEVTEFLGLPILSTELDSDLELPENIKYIKVEGYISDEDFDSGFVLINGQNFKVLNKETMSYGLFKPEAILEISKNVFSNGTGLIVEDEFRLFFIQIESIDNPAAFRDIQFKPSEGLSTNPEAESAENLPLSLPEGFDENYKPVIYDLGAPIDPGIRDTLVRTIGTDRFSVVWQAKKAVCDISAVTSAYNSLTGTSYDTYDMASALFSSYSKVPLLEPFNLRTRGELASKFGYTPDFLESDEGQRSILNQATYIQSNYVEDAEPGKVSSFAALGIDINEVDLKSVVSESSSPEENAQKLLEYLADNVDENTRFLISFSLGGEKFIGKHVLNIVGVNLEEGYIILADTNAFKEADFYGSATENGFMPLVSPVQALDAENSQEGLYGYWKLSLKGQSPDKISTTLENINYLRMMTKFNSSN